MFNSLTYVFIVSQTFKVRKGVTKNICLRIVGVMYGPDPTDISKVKKTTHLLLTKSMI